MSHTSVTYHFVFCTYCRKPTIDISHEKELYKFIHDFAGGRGAIVWRIGGMPDHVHLLCDVPVKMAVSDFIKLLKAESSKFMRVNPHFPQWEKWAAEYFVASVDASLRLNRIEYIKNQKQHHSRLSFADEYRTFLKEYGFNSDGPILGDILP